MKILLSLLSAVLLAGCATQGGGGSGGSLPFFITTSDIQQAEWVDDMVKRTPGVAGKYHVLPGANTTTVTFDMDLPPEQEENVKWNMQRMSAELSRSFKKVNKLIFHFKNAELEQ